jgi:thiol-disulfide isomerase/thioredoxin
MKEKTNERKNHKKVNDSIKQGKKNSLSKKVALVILFACIGIILIIGIIKIAEMTEDYRFDSLEDKSSYIKTFQLKENASVCTQDGKPVIRLFTTTWCPHCKWVKDDFDSVVKEYVNKGLIVAYHWEVDTNDDALTEVNEGSVPASELAIFKEFNPRTSIPTFVFGCKYYRVGNGYESVNDHKAERRELKAVIEELIKETGE